MELSAIETITQYIPVLWFHFCCQAIGRLTKYLEQGGKLILQGTQPPEVSEYYYSYVGSEKFFALSVTPEFCHSALIENGYKDISNTIQLLYPVIQLMLQFL